MPESQFVLNQTPHKEIALKLFSEMQFSPCVEARVSLKATWVLYEHASGRPQRRCRRHTTRCGGDNVKV